MRLRPLPRHLLRCVCVCVCVRSDSVCTWLHLAYYYITPAVALTWPACVRLPLVHHSQSFARKGCHWRVRLPVFLRLSAQVSPCCCRDFSFWPPTPVGGGYTVNFLVCHFEYCSPFVARSVLLEILPHAPHHPRTYAVEGSGKKKIGAIQFASDKHTAQEDLGVWLESLKAPSLRKWFIFLLTIFNAHIHAYICSRGDRQEEDWRDPVCV